MKYDLEAILADLGYDTDKDPTKKNLTIILLALDSDLRMAIRNLKMHMHYIKGGIDSAMSSMSSKGWAPTTLDQELSQAAREIARFTLLARGTAQTIETVTNALTAHVKGESAEIVHLNFDHLYQD